MAKWGMGVAGKKFRFTDWENGVRGEIDTERDSVGQSGLVPVHCPMKRCLMRTQGEKKRKWRSEGDSKPEKLNVKCKVE